MKPVRLLVGVLAWGITETEGGRYASTASQYRNLGPSNRVSLVRYEGGSAVIRTDDRALFRVPKDFVQEL